LGSDKRKAELEYARDDVCPRPDMNERTNLLPDPRQGVWASLGASPKSRIRASTEIVSVLLNEHRLPTTQSRSFSWDTLAVEDAAKSVVITTSGLTVTPALIENEVVRHCSFCEQVDAAQTKPQSFSVSKRQQLAA